MSTEQSLNTHDYWKSRFARDWDVRAGRERTKFLAELALRHLPEWIVRDIRTDGLGVLDWGCAEGDGTDALARELGTRVIGAEVAEPALESARTRFPDRRFLHGVADGIEAHDVLFTSDTLEHFENPFEILGALLAHTRRYAIVLIPLRGGKHRGEHPRAFDLDGVPCRIGAFHLLSFEVIDTAGLQEARWPRRWLLALYGEEKAVPPERWRLSTLASASLVQIESLRDTTAGLAGGVAALRNEIQRVRATRIQKWATVLGSALRRPFGTFATILRWLRGSYRPLGIGLTGALCSDDPLWRLEARAQEALDRLGDSVPASSAPIGSAGGVASDSRAARRRPRIRRRTWRATLSAVLRLRKAAYRRGAPLVALQVDEFDKGGLEEVVLTLARHLGRNGSIQVLVLVAGDAVGYLGDLARDEGIAVLPLGRDRILLYLVLRLLPIRLVNLHYSTFGVDVYAWTRTPIVYSVHNTYLWADSAFARERSKAYRRTTAFIAVSEPVRDFFTSKFGVDPRLVETIPNGLDLESVAGVDPVSRASLGLAADDVVFVNVASITWNKFHLLMVAAMEQVVRRFPQAKLLFVGDARDPAYLLQVKEDIRERQLDGDVRILDYLPKSRLVGLLEASDCFVLPSLFEGWSIAVMEAMYAGLPLILSDVGSARMVIRDGDIGTVIPNPFGDARELTLQSLIGLARGGSSPPNLDELVHAMESICRDREGWKLRARAGRERVIGTYTAAHMCERYLSCYRRLIFSGKGGGE